MRFRSLFIFGFLVFLGGCWGAAVVGIIELSDDGSGGTNVITNLPTSFSLIEPADTKMDVLSATPRFTWTDANNETGYVVQVKANANFNGLFVYQSPILPAGTTAHQVPLGVLSFGTSYYWRVVAENSSGTTVAMNGPFSFQALDTPWGKTFGGSNLDMCYSIDATNDGGVVLAGRTDSFGASAHNFWAIRIANDGSIPWQFAYPGPTSVQTIPRPQLRATADGGFIGAYYHDSLNTGAFYTFWVFKLNADGLMAWQKSYSDSSGSLRDMASTVEETVAGEFIVGGNENGADIDPWLLRIDSVGNKIWHKEYDGAGQDYFEEVGIATDGDYYVCGHTTTWTAGGTDAWILKIAPDGTVPWQKVVGGASDEKFYDLAPTPDGGVIAVGFTRSEGAGSGNILVVKFGLTGTTDWKKVIGDGGGQGAQAVHLTGDGGYVLAGGTSVLKLDSVGEIVWQQQYSGLGARDVIPAANGGFHVAGGTGAGVDFILLTIGPNGELPTIASATSFTNLNLTATPNDSLAAPVDLTVLQLNNGAGSQTTTAIVNRQTP